MPGTAVGLFIIDFIVRTYAKILEKMPLVIILLLVILYSVIAYLVLKSAYSTDDPY